MDETIVRSIGNFGRYQLWIVLIVFLNKFPVAWHPLIIAFIAPPAQFECTAPEGITDKCSPECTEHTFDRSVFTETIVTQWNLICDKEYYISIAQSSFMFGILIGNIFFGILSDKFGRRPPFVFSAILQFFGGVGSALSPWYWLFILMRFITGVATGGSMLISFVILMELVGPSVREPVSILFQLPFNFGQCTLPVFAYFIRDWKNLELAISSVSVIYVSYYCLIPESPRWLFTSGQLDKAAAVLERAARFNKLPDTNIRSDLEEAKKRKDASNSGPAPKGSVIDLFRYPHLRLKTFAMSFSWLVCGLTFYGTVQYISGISGNIFVNIAISGALCVPGTLITVPMTKYFGRKITLITSNTIAGLCMISIAFLPQKQDFLKVILASFGVFGVMMSFCNVYLYWAELLPTVLRNTGMGFGSMIARVGGMIAPFVVATGKKIDWIPPVIFGTVPLIGAILVFLLPETKGHPIPETIEDSENFSKRIKENN